MQCRNHQAALCSDLPGLEIAHHFRQIPMMKLHVLPCGFLEGGGKTILRMPVPARTAFGNANIEINPVGFTAWMEKTTAGVPQHVKA